MVLFKTPSNMIAMRRVLLAATQLALFSGTSLFGADVSGKLDGVVKDQSGSIVPRAVVMVTNRSTGVTQKSRIDGQGAFAFPVLPIGNYGLEVSAEGFKSYQKSDLVVDLGTAAQLEITLEISAQSQTVEVIEGATQVETTDTQLGQVIASKQVTDVPLNGRSYTDLFALQGGVTPISTGRATNSSSGGGFGTVPVAGAGNTGQFSIHGQRESANGFFLNGASVQETIGQQAGVIPNLDSIAEFRILTSNTDAEYGFYSGGLINVVTKSGGNGFHGSLFEFLRNTDFDARGFFDPQRGSFQQNQYGGTVGGRIIKNKLFFFGDYQGQRTIQGIETGLVTVPSLAQRSGNFQDAASTLTGTVNGTYLAQTLTNRLRYPVRYQEPFYFQGCASNAQCVFPNAVIPQRALSASAQRMLKYIPQLNASPNQFASGSEKLRLKDGKGSGRVDASTEKHGTFSLYYFLDKYDEDNPYPSGFGGATVPGYNALSQGMDQLAVLSHTMSLGASAVNEVRLSYTRLNNNLGIPKGGVGVSLADQGISNGTLV